MIPFLTAFIVSFSLVPLLRKLSLTTGFVDQPSKRKIHHQAIPLMGGVAIYLSCALSLMLYDGFTSRSLTVILGGGLLVFTGLVDDWFKTKGLEFPVSPRLYIYIGASIFPLLFGVQIEGIRLWNDSMYLFSDWASWLTTMLWIFALINMINFIDGVDGLAPGISLLSSLTLFAAAFIKGQYDAAVFAIILAGACLAFLSYNFYPARIFMGDAGAVFLGYALAVLAIDGSFKRATVISFVVPFLALGVPILDTAIVFTRRLLKGKGLHTADRLHTHHTLMKRGFSQVQTVAFLYTIGALFSIVSIILLMKFG
jgi:UDP-GlcNAc:undecaprenyl-phosphate GlcNAc-1-phosphate transferase